MFAIIETGGKQYKVQEGDRIVIEKLDLNPGEKVVFDRVLLIENNGQTLIGNPYIPNARVEGKLIEQIKGEKIIVFKKKRKKGYKKKTGHRQKLSEVQIEKIIPDYKKAKPKTPKKKETPEAKEKKASKSNDKSVSTDQSEQK
ncbi:50S ribosomal protein L21 [Candidatus Aminicenantes bacterium AC-708-M15]|jgi:large subunit ribosomal protein L21|nr:50S ribosomal protein L21 [SCandidatus Aminicenantes bacterium Aminicenantia_JdfR_composite]MCP2596820.1 50S ribosomal protein L21 [Candidatus Aminicenantes bacterium AC-335-G13]MCP2598281.1 50S ribosomal protein L21 [Candidatus Aminicenantes bacterium AC-335-L06]MCP2604020.1 50S ribosomal protein L21 [Candidatus Aminicenantes bacterium AC-708-M15]MCP2606493.1 50S ribosomal protein L21 [Candidatus Aminicenantes bacterium AC-708-I09]MCP2618487.1 50S ribosomal protein L21 [Candidatus Aminicen